MFKIDSTGHETILHGFGNGSDGYRSWAPLIRDAAGNLYGTTAYGGTYGLGTVFKIDASDVETVLYSFAGGSDGTGPLAGLVRDSAGDLFGTTIDGGGLGLCGIGCGTVFKIDSTGHETVLHRFAGGADGEMPYAPVIRANGYLYGTTSGGGANGAGIVFQVNASTGKETIFYNFGSGGSDGLYPVSGLVRDSAGNFYGSTGSGGTYGWGTVFKLDSTGKEKILYNFSGGSDGAIPVGGVIRDSYGNLYGATQQGGTGPYGGYGTMFELSN